MPNHPDIADELLHASRRINSPADIDAQLDAIVQTAKTSLPEIDHAGISIAYPDGRIETRAATDPIVHELDDLQYTLREGPCVHAIEADPVVVVEYARHDERWPHFLPSAVALGLRSQLGVRLYIDQKSRGGLNLYSTSSDRIDPETAHLAELFAAHAALALGRVHLRENLNTALQSRSTIGMALGIVMERYGLDRDLAFTYLTRVASRKEIKVREVATLLVDELDSMNRQEKDQESVSD